MDDVETDRRRRDTPVTAHHFPVLRTMSTRWSDNDMYGHLNNAAYYQLFDAAINAWIIEHTDIDPTSSGERNVVVESGCRFFSPAAFPRPVTVGIGVARLGTSSVTYDLGLFSGDDMSARGHWVHVYVAADVGRPVPIPSPIRDLLTTAVGEEAPS